MKRGVAEQECFDSVKSFLFSDTRIDYVCSAEDRETIENAFKTAKPNDELSKFPDFIFETGFIEHFEVTSSYQNRKGSTMEREKSEIEREISAKEEELKSEMNVTPYYKGKTVSVDKWYSSHSYDNFYYSFSKSWKHHIESLNNYTGAYKNGIFMIQYNDSALLTRIDYSDIKTDLYYGDLLPKLKNNSYRLVFDSKILEYIYQYKDKIKYVVFFNNDCFHGLKCEIICVENIPEILKIVKGKYKFSCATIGASMNVIGISCKNQ